MKASKNTIAENNGKTRLIEVITNVTGETTYKLSENVNREVKESHVKKLMKSFSTYGTAGLKITVLKTSAFTGVSEYIVADGQNSITACNRLGLAYSVFIIELEDDTEFNVRKYISAVNNNNKGWAGTDYLSTYANNGIREYKTFAHLKKTTGLQITDLQFIFLGDAGAKNIEDYKEGRMKFINEEDSQELLKYTLLAKQYIPKRSQPRRSFHKIMRLAQNYKKMANAIIEMGESLALAGHTFSEDETILYNQLLAIYQKEFKVKK